MGNGMQTYHNRPCAVETNLFSWRDPRHPWPNLSAGSKGFLPAPPQTPGLTAWIPQFPGRSDIPARAKVLPELHVRARCEPIVDRFNGFLVSPVAGFVRVCGLVGGDNRPGGRQ